MHIVPSGVLTYELRQLQAKGWRAPGPGSVPGCCPKDGDDQRRSEATVDLTGALATAKVKPLLNSEFLSSQPTQWISNLQDKFR